MKILRAKLIKLAILQPLSYFEKYHDILCNNLWVAVKKANRERNRKDGNYSFTAQVIEQTEVKRLIIDCWFLEQIIKTKEILVIPKLGLLFVTIGFLIHMGITL